jgi:hypothetical protein
MVEIYKDYIPANARIIIDYKAHEKVKFFYPREWTYRKAVLKCAFPTVMGFFLLAHIYPIFVYIIIHVIKSIIGMITYTGASVTVTTHQTVIYHDLQALIPYGILIVFAVFYIFLIPLFITLFLATNKERLSKWVPKLGYWGVLISGMVKEKTFIKVAIPNFSNVYLKYNTTKDFNKYLEKVEIWELPFDYIRRIWFFRWRVKNDLHFRAVFFFSEEPKKGEMKVRFA